MPGIAVSCISLPHWYIFYSLPKVLAWKILETSITLTLWQKFIFIYLLKLSPGFCIWGITYQNMFFTEIKLLFCVFKLILYFNKSVYLVLNVPTPWSKMRKLYFPPKIMSLSINTSQKLLLNVSLFFITIPVEVSKLLFY